MRPNKKSYQKRLLVLITYLLLIFLAGFVLFPLLWIISTSIKPSSEIFAIPSRWIPNNLTLQNYTNVLFASAIPKYFINSLVTGLLATVLSLILGGAAGYGFARYKFKGNKSLSLFMLLSQMLPLTVLMIPIYFLMLRLNLLDSIFGLALAHLILTMPLVTWMTRSYFIAIPKELEEAALVDGCSPLKALFKVIIPIAAPGIAATGIYAFIMSWNEFVLASVLTSSATARTLPIGLTEFSIMFEVDWGSTMAAATLISLPVIIFFLWLQKHFVQGLSQGAVKG
ncbi:MAG: carbohydrate ABC transporter permease [Halanaerobiales bacterium]|nr:carbohydrate ABC transporter permease [Halanaerobiales bacterium]